MSFQYDRRVQDALRSVVKGILTEVVEKGLPDPHHFYISVRTSYPGVEFPDSVKKANPKEVTIVLQHQFWDLVIDDRGFSVVLTFQDIPQKIYVPFFALLSFMDPSVRFGLHFTPPSTEEALAQDNTLSATNAAMGEGAADKNPEEKGKIISLDSFRKKT